MTSSQATDLASRCDLLRSLHRPGAPLLLPNAWDVATARAVVAAGFPVVATTSGGVAAALGYEDHEGAPADEMLAAAARIARGVEVPVTVDAEAGYGMEPAELVAALRSAGAAGCNLEDTDYAAGSLRDPDRHAEWLRAVRQAASEDGYRLVINARVDVFLGPLLAGAGPGTQEELVPEALRRANAYLEAGVDCVYPIALWETDALRRFIVGGPRPGERRANAAGAVARRAGRAGRGPGELGTLPVPRRDGALRGPARFASGLRTGLRRVGSSGWSRGGSAKSAGDRGGFLTRPHVEPSENALDVRANRFRRNGQRGGDLLGGSSFAEKVEYFPLPSRQWTAHGSEVLPRGGLAADLLDQPHRQASRDGRLPSQRAEDRPHERLRIQIAPAGSRPRRPAARAPRGPRSPRS